MNWIENRDHDRPFLCHAPRLESKTTARRSCSLRNFQKKKKTDKLTFTPSLFHFSICRIDMIKHHYHKCEDGPEAEARRTKIEVPVQHELDHSREDGGHQGSKRAQGERSREVNHGCRLQINTHGGPLDIYIYLMVEDALPCVCVRVCMYVYLQNCGT